MMVSGVLSPRAGQPIRRNTHNMGTANDPTKKPRTRCHLQSAISLFHQFTNDGLTILRMIRKRLGKNGIQFSIGSLRTLQTLAVGLPEL